MILAKLARDQGEYQRGISDYGSAIRALAIRVQAIRVLAIRVLARRVLVSGEKGSGF